MNGFTLAWSDLGGPVAGGILIGLSAGGFYLIEGRTAGISGIVKGALAGDRAWWRWAFLAGLVIAGLTAAALGVARPPALARTPWPVLTIAGLLVGLGAGIGSGCTSGHGVCGIARLSPRSLVAVAVFMATGAATVWLMRHIVL